MRGKAAASSDAVPTSKAHRHDQQTSDQYSIDRDALKRSTTAPSVTPVKPAYAGPTFHASPAASALPMPKFLSKSVPDPNADQGLQALMEREEAKDDHEVQANEPRNSSLSTQAVQSPLEIFFRADREEKARRVVSSPGHNSPSSRASPLSTRHQTPADRDLSAVGSPFKRPVSTGQYGKEMFMMELNDSSPERASVQNAHQHHYSRPNNQTYKGQYVKAKTDHGMQRQCGRAENGLMSTPQQAATSTKSDFNHFQAGNRTCDISTPDTTAVASQRHGSYGATESTPSTATNDDQYLYGNRNLSPIFKASKADSPSHKLSSGLRREVTDSLLSSSSKDIKPAKPSKAPVDGLGSSDNAAAAAISRNYLQSHIQGSPKIISNNGNNDNKGSFSSSQMSQIPMARRPKTVDGSMNASSYAPGTAHMAGRDNIGRHGAIVQESLSKLGSVESMEKDLRKLLKMKVDD